MIDVYTWPTSNGHKIHIMLEETGLKYAIHPINIQDGDQFKPAFLKISPNNKMPAIVDRDGPGGRNIPVFETGAILIYLANKTGTFMPDMVQDPQGYYDVMQWLMFQVSCVGPMLGQAHHFNAYARERFAAEQIDYGRNRYVNEANRIYGVIDRRLKRRQWIAGDQYSIADIAIFPWLRDPVKQGVDITAYPEVERWRRTIWHRPAVIRALDTLKERARRGSISDRHWEVMFGATQHGQGGATVE